MGFRATSRRPNPWKRLCGTWRSRCEAVVLLNLDMSILFKRLTGRRICQDCGRVFNVYTSPPGTLPHCDKCGDSAPLIQRPDDKEEVIGKRLEVYEAQTKPLIKHYESTGLLRVVDADADVETVFKGIRARGAGRVRLAAGRSGDEIPAISRRFRRVANPPATASRARP